MVVRATALRILARCAELAVAPNGSRKNASGQPRMIRTMVPSPSKEQCGSTKLAHCDALTKPGGTSAVTASVGLSTPVTAKGNAQLSTLTPDSAHSQKNGNRAVPVSGKGRNLNEHLEGLVRLTEALVQWTLTSSRALS